MLDSPEGQDQQWEPLVATTGDHADFAKRYGPANQQNVIQFLAFDPENPNSILSCLRGARENARTVREIISSEMWLQLNKFYLMVNEAAPAGTGWRSPHEFFDEVKNASHLFNGDHRGHHDAWRGVAFRPGWAACWSARTRPRASSM